MIKFNKKLYYKYFDFYRLSSFLKDTIEVNRSQTVMKIVKEADKMGLDLSDRNQLCLLNIDTLIKDEIILFKETNSIPLIERYYSKVEDWIKYIILPDFFDIDFLSDIFSSNNIRTREELMSYFSSKSFMEAYGAENAELYYHYVEHSDWCSFPIKYAKRYSAQDSLDNKYKDISIKGNFHNHTIYSDGIYNIKELMDIAISNNYEYLGISDHTQAMAGISDKSILEQHDKIDALNKNSTCRILKSAECEILNNGNLDLNNDSLSKLDYTIIAIHKQINQVKRIAEQRLIKAIENPYSNILAHPSGRLYKRKVGMCVDMYKIIDACIANNVAIEINGDPDRLDLDPRYIKYALDKGAMFTFDSDTHLANSFYNINNATKIAYDYHIPAERCLNTMGLSELKTFFSKNNV